MAVLRLRPRRGLPIGLGGARGFTLLELMAVVLIITVFAALAVPSAVAQLRDRRVQEAARRLGMVYREARLRALGRGSAVLVRMLSGDITVMEARVGTDVGGVAGCSELPVSSCLNTDWSNPLSRRIVGGFHVPTSGEQATMTVALSDSANAPVTNLDICFTPMGRVFSRRAIAVGTAFGPIDGTYVATVNQPGLTRTRRVALMPNGTARLMAQ
jgi:prepilin-type N-terminal cleavage/methylation domain-containing protein